MGTTLDDDEVKYHLENIARLSLSQSLTDYEERNKLGQGTANSWVKGKSRAGALGALSPEDRDAIDDWREGRPKAKAAFLRRFIAGSGVEKDFAESERMPEGKCGALLRDAKMQALLIPKERELLKNLLGRFTDDEWQIYGVNMLALRQDWQAHQQSLAARGISMTEDQSYQYLARSTAQRMSPNFAGQGGPSSSRSSSEAVEKLVARSATFPGLASLYPQLQESGPTQSSGVERHIGSHSPRSGASRRSR